MLNPEREARVIVVGFGEDFRIVRMGTQIEGYSTSYCSMRMASFKARNRPSPGFKAFAALRSKACTRCSKSVWRTLRLRPPARQFLKRPLNDAASLPKWE